MDNFTVYKHTSPSGKVYIGITGKNPERRWRPDGSGYKKNYHLWNAIKHYGWNNFSHEILASGLTKEAACALEVKLIAEYDAMNPEKGYNASEGGEHPPFTETTRNKISEAVKLRDIKGERNPNYGNHKLAGRNNPNYGQKHSEEARALMSVRRKGKGTGPKNAETIKLMREHHAGGSAPKMVLCVETGEVFESINAAAKAKSALKSRVSGCCRKKPHYNTAGGYHWEFV